MIATGEGEASVVALASKYLTASDMKNLEAAPSRGISSSNEGGYGELGIGWTITDEMRAALTDSSWLENEVQDEGLNQLILKITSTPNIVAGSARDRRHRGKGKDLSGDSTTQREMVLHELQTQFPEFRRFLDKLLVLAGVLERQDPQEASMPIHEWLKNHGDASKDRLQLKPLPRKERLAQTSRDEETSASSVDVGADDDESTSSNSTSDSDSATTKES
jgi:hypothetical protein